MVWLMLALGLVALFAGGEFLVRGAVGIARRFGVPPLVIGLTIVGFGTSMPELLVSVQAALSGTPAIAVGNVVGSNLANILLILAVAAAIAPVVIRPEAMVRDFVAMVLATLAAWGLMWTGEIGRLAGLALVAALALYLWISLRSGAEVEDLGDDAPPALWKSVLRVAAGLAALVLGAQLLVDSASAIARSFGVSEAVIGLTVVAVGTSLPELATSVVAAIRRHSEIAFGNVVGSNLFNLLGILGATAAIHPVPVDPRFVRVDMPILTAVTLGLVALAIAARGIGRLGGLAMLGGYATYVGLAGLA